MFDLDPMKSTGPFFRRRILAAPRTSQRASPRTSPWSGAWSALMGIAFVGFMWWGLAGEADAKEHYLIPPLKVEIVDAKENIKGRALVYPSYIELTGLQGNLRGKIGVVILQGKAQLYLIRANEERKFIGWAKNFRLYNSEDKLTVYYFWSPIWSFVYDPKMKYMGKAQCIAYQGLCAAAIAGFLLGLY